MAKKFTHECGEYELTEDGVREFVDEVIDNDVFDEELNSCEDSFSIRGNYYNASETFKAVDEYAYDNEFEEYKSEKASEWFEHLQKYNGGENVSLDSVWDVTIVADEEEENIPTLTIDGVVMHKTEGDDVIIEGLQYSDDDEEEKAFNLKLTKEQAKGLLVGLMTNYLN